ncbi:hypothetical protein BJ170DRAFT_272388 [Xylariales sp. AK1849]|nr:hypothetical protein BJ170DRAFT_272388 [Xylariales sp. AK1849]
MGKDRDGDTSAPTGQTGQSKRPSLNHHVSHDSDSQLSDHTSQSQSQRPKQHHKQHARGGGRLHSRVPSSKALHKSHHSTSSFVKLSSQPRRQPSPEPEPERPEQTEPPPMLPSAHRRSASDVKLSRDSSASNLKQNTSHTNLKRNRSHAEVAKKSKSATNIKRSSSHKEVSKLKSGKGSVHFDLGNDGQDDEWVDASGSASPYLSRRGSVVSSGQASVKPEAIGDGDSRPHTPFTESPGKARVEEGATPDRQRVQHKEYLTSRLLQRTPSQGAPPKMSSDTALVPPRSASPDSAESRASSTLYASPKPANVHVASGATDELTSRFVNGPGSGVNPDTGSFYSPIRANERANERVKRPRSLGNLQQEHRNSITEDPDDDDESALAPRTRRSGYKAAPAEKSRTQQKLNLQRASSSIDPVPAGGGVARSAVGASPLVGGAGYDNRDPRVGKLLERTGMEYMVVRRYQTPIARSIARVQKLPGAEKTQHIPKQTGTNGSMHGKKSAELGGPGRFGLSSSLEEAQRPRPGTPRRHTSIRTNGANSSFEADEDRTHDRLSGSSYVEGEDENVATLLRNLWDKSMDLSASQD